MTPEGVRSRLIGLADEKYRVFSASLIPNADNVLGVRMPALRALAREIAAGGWRTLLAAYGLGTEKTEGTEDSGASEVRYMEEDLLPGLVLTYAEMPLEELFSRIAAYLPRIGNWAVNDSFTMGIRAFDRYPEKSWAFIKPYFRSDREFEVRFAAVAALAHFVREEYVERVLEELLRLSSAGYFERALAGPAPAAKRSESAHPARTAQAEKAVLPKGAEPAHPAPAADGGKGALPPHYYAKMAVAWAYSVCFVKFPRETRAAFDRIGDTFILRKSISKTLESFRVSEEDKTDLRKFRENKFRKGKDL